MYGKLAITCFKYQVYLYGSEAITYLNAFLWGPTSGSPHPSLLLFGTSTI
jgi:hypothetical protein